MSRHLLSPSLPSNRDVAQTGSLLCLRLATGGPADCQSAKQQVANRRYMAAASGYGAPGAHTVRGSLSSILNGGEGARRAGEKALFGEATGFHSEMV